MRFGFLQIVSFTCIFLLVFSLGRLIMGIEFLGIGTMLNNPKDTLLLFSLGAVSDLRLISAALLPFLVCMLLTLFKPLWLRLVVRGGGAKPS